jgi:bacteriocin biosynthesis cyclodehydratase domain-containing protein
MTDTTTTTTTPATTESTFFRLRPHVSVIVHGPDEVEFRHGIWNPVSINLSDDTRQGKLAGLVTKLDGTIATGRLAAAESVPREQVEQLVDRLFELDLLERGPSSAFDAYLATTAPWRVDDTAAASGARVLLLGDDAFTPALAGMLSPLRPGNPIEEIPPDDPAMRVLADPDTSWLTDGLATEERLAAFEPWRGSVVVAPCQVIDPIRFTVLNRACLRHGIRWVHAALDGPFVFIGPSFLPGESPCYECLETRVFLNLREGAGYQRYKRALAEARVRLGTVPLLPPLAGLLSAHLALETINLVRTGTTFTIGRMLAIHLPTMELSFPEVLRVPGCAGCGSVPERDGQVLYYDLPMSTR